MDMNFSLGSYCLKTSQIVVGAIVAKPYIIDEAVKTS